MIIRDFEPKHTEEAAEIALGAYNNERAFTQELPEISSIPILNQLSGNGFGVAAFEGGKMVGYLCSVEPFENVFRSTDVRGVFSPMGANGAVMENHGKIYAALYQAAAKKWVKAGAVSHAICLYEHDEEAKHTRSQSAATETLKPYFRLSVSMNKTTSTWLSIQTQ